MKKCSNHRPDFKELEFKENPSRKNIFDLQPSSANFNKFNYFRLEEPQKPYLLQRGVKYVCECWDKDIKTLHTGLIPIGERTGERTGEPCYYFGDHIETVRNKTKSSLMIFRLCPGYDTIKIYYFNHFNKRSILMKLQFCRNFINQLNE